MNITPIKPVPPPPPTNGGIVPPWLQYPIVLPICPPEKP